MNNLGAAALGRVAALSPGHAFNPVLATLGDSITNRASINTATSKVTTTVGISTWLNMLMGQRFNFPLANNFGVAGDVLSQIAVRVPNVIAAKPGVCLVLGGTNDVTNGVSLDSMKSTMSFILASLLAAGIFVVVLPILPRTTSSGLGVTTSDGQKRQIAAFNRWLSELCWGRADLVATAGLPPGRLPLFVDPRPALMDMANSTGDPLTGMFLDGLHPTELGAYTAAVAVKNALTNLIPARPTAGLEVEDIYDATYNLAGNRLFSGSTNLGLLAGTTGTLTTSSGLTPTGSVATGWRGARGFGSSSASTLVFAKENPRTDGPASGERQRMTVTLGGTGGVSQEKYQLFISGVTGGLAAGDTVVFEAAYQLAATPASLQSIEIAITETGPASPQTAGDGYYNSTVTGGHIYPQVAHSGVLRTPPITLQSGFTGINVACYVYMNAVSGVGSADIYWSDVSLRKVV